MLSDIRRFLSSKNDLVSLYELASHFDVEESIMSGMMNHWLRKGRVKKIDSSCNKGCGGCDRATEGEWYQWIKDDQVQVLIPLGCTL